MDLRTKLSFLLSWMKKQLLKQLSYVGLDTYHAQEHVACFGF